jgi:hypothetical protein
MQPDLSVMGEFRIDGNPSLQKEIDNAGSAELASPSVSVAPLLLGGQRLQTAVVVEETLHDVEPRIAKAGGHATHA